MTDRREAGTVPGEAPPQENPFLIPPALVTPILKVHALETFPLTPDLWKVNFSRGRDFEGDGDLEIARRLADQGIIPGMTIIVITEFKTGSMILDQVRTYASRDEPEASGIRNLQLTGVVGGDAPERFEFNCRASYEQFRRHTLPQLLVRGYEVLDFDLQDTGGMSQLTDKAHGAGIKANYWGMNLGTIGFHGRLSPEDEQKLTDWFAGIKAGAEAAAEQQPQSPAPGKL